MITINLLPQELRPIKRTPVPYIISGAVLALTVLAVGAVYVQDVARIFSANSLLEQHKQERDLLQPIIDEANELADKKRELQEQVEAISEITSDRIIWSQQIYHLSRLALENLWYSKIEVAPRTTNITVNRYDPQKKKNVKERRRITNHFLVVDGFVVPGESGRPDIGPFTVSAERDEEFTRTFSLDPNIFLSDTAFEGNAVREFGLEFLVKTGGSAK